LEIGYLRTDVQKLDAPIKLEVVESVIWLSQPPIQHKACHNEARHIPYLTLRARSSPLGILKRLRPRDQRVFVVTKALFQCWEAGPRAICVIAACYDPQVTGRYDARHIVAMSSCTYISGTRHSGCWAEPAGKIIITWSHS
jgi:hypothetical protein